MLKRIKERRETYATIEVDKNTAVNGGDPIVNKQEFWELELIKVDAKTGKTIIGEVPVLKLSSKVQRRYHLSH